MMSNKNEKKKLEETKKRQMRKETNQMAKIQFNNLHNFVTRFVGFSSEYVKDAGR